MGNENPEFSRRLSGKLRKAILNAYHRHTHKKICKPGRTLANLISKVLSSYYFFLLQIHLTPRSLETVRGGWVSLSISPRVCWCPEAQGTPGLECRWCAIGPAVPGVQFAYKEHEAGGNLAAILGEEPLLWQLRGPHGVRARNIPALGTTLWPERPCTARP